MRDGCRCQTAKIENMGPITVAIAKEVATEAAKKIAEKATEKAIQYAGEKAVGAIRPKTDNPVIYVCERLSSEIKAGTLSDAALETRIEAAAHSACKFFGLPEAELLEGDSIAVRMKRCDFFMTDDKFIFNLDQFKDMNTISFEDMSKIWSHECGHRVLRFYNMSPWAQELGADFFMGIRSEMLGLPNSNVERVLGASKGGHSHPPGNLRIQAIEYGRKTVQEYNKAGEPITMQNMRETFRLSQFAKITGEQINANTAAFINDKSWFYKEVAKAQENADYYLKEAKKAADNRDLRKAGDMQFKADYYTNEVKNAKSNAELCTKLVTEESLQPSEKIRLKTETGWSDKTINSIRSIEESNVYKNAGLVEVDGNLKRVDIDWNAKIPQDRIDRIRKLFGEEAANKWSGKTNIDLIKDGKAPYGPDGKQVNLHHIGQKPDSPLAELTDTEHKVNDSILHNKTKVSEIERTVFRDERKAYWQSRYEELSQ